MELFYTLLALGCAFLIGWFAHAYHTAHTPITRSIEITVDSTQARNALAQIKKQIDDLEHGSEGFYIPARKVMPFYGWLIATGNINKVHSLMQLQLMWGDFLIQEEQAKGEA